MKDITSQTQQLAETLHNVNPLWESLLSALQTPGGWIVLLALVVWSLLNKDLSRIFDLFERGKVKRLAYLDEYVSKPGLADPETIEIIKDFRDAHYFKVATGIYAEESLRASLIRLHKSLPNDITWRHLSRAFPHLKLGKEGDILVTISWFETFSFIYNAAIGFLCLAACMALIAYAAFYQNSVKDFILILVASVIPFLFTLAIFSQNWPIIAARRIRKELACLKIDSIEKNKV